MKLYALFALTALALTGCQDVTGSDPEIIDSFGAHRNSGRDRPGTTCIAAARGAEHAAMTYRSALRGVRRLGQESMAQAEAMFESLVAEHQKVIAECSGSSEGTFTIGGTLSGLAAQNTVLLQNNGVDDLLVAANGQFTFATPLTDGGGYTVTIGVSPTGQSCFVADGSGTVTGAGVTTVQVQCTDVPTTVGVPTNPGDLVVSEVMPNPTAVTDATGEWFEIYNPTTSAFELMGLVVRDDGSNIFTVDQSLIIQPGAFLAFGLNADAATNGGATVAFAYSGFTLANSSDEIELVFGDIVIDRFAYAAGFPLVAGQAMSLTATSLDDVSNDSSTNWCSAVDALAGGDLGTPGSPNGPC